MILDPQDAQRIDEKPESKDSQQALSAEEQMERFEDDLKENDWGHQPC